MKLERFEMKKTLLVAIATLLVSGMALGQDLVARVAIDLQRAREALKMPDRLLGSAVGRVEIGHARRI